MMNITDPYSPTLRTNASAKPIRITSVRPRQEYPRDSREARGAKSCSRRLDFAIDIFQHGLNGSHHKGKTDEDESD